MTYFVVDIESDGPFVPKYSMVSFGAVVLDEKLDRTFYGQVRPISPFWIPEALAVSGHTRDETLRFPTPEIVMPQFVTWVGENNKKGSSPIFVSDNNGYDFSFMNYYLWEFTHGNIFGHHSRNMSDLFKGMEKNIQSRFQHLKRTTHTHHPVDDAKGNAEALLTMRTMGLKLPL